MSFQEYLAASGRMDTLALQRAVAAQASSDASEGRLLADLGLISHQDLFTAYAEYFHLDKKGLEDLPAAPVELALNPAFLAHHTLLPLSVTGEVLVLATPDPTATWPLRATEFATGLTVQPCLMTEKDIKAGLDQLYGDEQQAEEAFSLYQDDDIARLQELATDAPVIRYVDRLIDTAAHIGASDIHFEPGEGGLTVRLRRDGLLQEADAPDQALAEAVLSRVKILAGLDIAERRLPQDGRIRQTVHGRELDFRVSTIPTLHGESIVLRLLDRVNVPDTLQKLGFVEADANRLYAAASHSEGIILVTGPTGSGKTTTLYALLNRLNTPGSKLLTVEDPIEYRLKGVNQVQVENKIGRTFAATLRSFLRQDPDIIMVGEIRDTETAEIAFRAAETGHLVLSTLHTNDAASAVTRLKDMGLKGFMMAGPLRAIVAQRLVRLLCNACKRQVALDETDQKTYGCTHAHEASSCPDCGNSGYRGRQVISEVIDMNDELRSLIKADTDAKTLAAAARRAGTQSLFDSGAQLVRDGLTTVAELRRVTRD